MQHIHQLSSQSKEALGAAVYNPGGDSIFPVSSVVLEGKSEVVLVDAQFQKDDAHAVLDMIKKTGKSLKTIYISHGDPDFYFGLDTILEAHPEAKVVATLNTQQHIKESMKQKENYWRPILKDNAPDQLITPQVMDHSEIFLDSGEELDIMGLDSQNPDHTYLYIPSINTVLGGVVVYGNMHVFMADTADKSSRQKWLKTLDEIDALKPTRVIPGHFLGDAPMTLKSVNFTRQYIKDFEKAAEQSKDSTALIQAMNEKYPDIGGDDILALSAKVVMGEQPWP